MCGVEACVVKVRPIRAPEEAALIITIIMLTTRNTHDGQSSVVWRKQWLWRVVSTPRAFKEHDSASNLC